MKVAVITWIGRAVVMLVLGWIVVRLIQEMFEEVS